MNKFLFAVAIAGVSIASASSVFAGSKYTIDNVEYDGYWKDHKFYLTDWSGYFMFYMDAIVEKSSKQVSSKETVCSLDKKAIYEIEGILSQAQVTSVCLSSEVIARLALLVQSLNKYEQKEKFDFVDIDKVKQVEKAKFVPIENKVIVKTKTIYKDWVLYLPNRLQNSWGK